MVSCATMNVVRCEKKVATVLVPVPLLNPVPFIHSTHRRSEHVRPMLGTERRSTENTADQDSAGGEQNSEVSNLKSARQRCYTARDAYYACVDASEKDSGTACRAYRAAFEASCARSWVEYFDQLREKEARVYRRVQDGIVASEKREETVGGLQGRHEDT